MVVQPKGNTRLTGSGSDICTCRPYLIYGIEEAVKCAQRGGVGLIVYFRKEGRALGEVTKCTFFYTFLAPYPTRAAETDTQTSCIILVNAVGILQTVISKLQR